MKTHTIDWTPIHTQDTRIVLHSPRSLQAALGVATRTLWALAAAAAVIVGAAWLASHAGLAPYLQALTWAGGFVFLALAVETESPYPALLSTATGLALPLLAWLSSRIAPELAIVAAALVAAWVAAWVAGAILRR